MNLCSICKKTPGELIFKGNNGEEKILCKKCAKSEFFDSFPHFAKQNSNPIDEIVDILENVIKNQDGFSNDDSTSNTSPRKFQKNSKSSTKGLLQDHCTDLTESARRNELDQVFGRDEEVDRLINILNRRTKNNPVLIGEPGVGKTAIAEALALKIIKGEVPEKLKDKSILSLDITSVTAGTMYRGMFEERMKKIAKEIELRDDVILFIDELHMIIGAGSSMDSNVDAANILKPYLARGKMQIIGATTLEEYRKIEEDSALSRRFQTIKVEEPDIDNTIKILQGLKTHYEDYHKVIYTDEAIKACAVLSDRYISERFMPDKAIDLMDEVGSKINLSKSKNSSDPRNNELEKLFQEEHISKQKDDFESAIKIRQQALKLKKSIEEEQKKAYSIKKQDVERVVERITGIPVVKIDTDERTGLINLSDRLNEHVIGQPEAIESVVKAIKRNRISIRKHHKPSTFLFIGPTGVGKTELTKSMAEELFGDKNAIIRFDMSEFMEEHSVSKLIGSPPGYVGHEEAGQLTEKVRRNPYSIILLDEIEKAHQKVLNILLQLYDEGRLTDSRGTTVDFSNTIIVMTSNLGATATKKISFYDSSGSENYEEAVKKFFSPELLNRIDKVVAFNHLSEENILSIVDLMLKDVISGLKEKNIDINIDKQAKKFLSEKGYQKEYGARPLFRTIIEYIDDPITEILIENTKISSINVTLDSKDDKNLKFNIK